MVSRAFVTGGSGFVGRSLIRSLVKDGMHVHALARSQAAADAVAREGAMPARGDLDDVTVLRTRMSGCDSVFHAAAHTAEWGSAQDFLRINVEGTRNVVDAARHAGVKRLVHVSTEAVLCDGQPLVDVDEKAPYPAKHAGLYAATKMMAEQIVVQANAPGALETVIVRPRLIWGPGDSSLLPKIAQAVIDKRFMWVDGGRVLTSTCHVDNVIEGARLAATQGGPGQIYFLSDGPPVELREFLTDLLATRGLDPGVREVSLGMARALATVSEAAWKLFKIKGAPPATKLAIALLFLEVTVRDAKARQELGYQGKTSRAQGLRAMKAS
jgi:nucleoside-diphosphate-sugar epimerase